MGPVTGTTLLVYALIAVIALVVLIARYKLNPFITLVVVSVLLGFAVGGATGFLIDAWTDGVALFLPAAIALVLAVIALGERGRPVDPTPGGLIG